MTGTDSVDLPDLSPQDAPAAQGALLDSDKQAEAALDALIARRFSHTSDDLKG